MKLMNLFPVFFLAFVGSCKISHETKTKNIDTAQDKFGYYLNVKISKDKCLNYDDVKTQVPRLSFDSIITKGTLYFKKDLSQCTLNVRWNGASTLSAEVDTTYLIHPLSSYFCDKDIAPHLASDLSPDKVNFCEYARNAIGNFLAFLIGTHYSVLDTNATDLSEEKRKLIVENKAIVEECFQPAFISTDDIPANPADLVKQYPNNSECRATNHPMRAWLTFIYAHTKALTNLFSEFDQDPWLKEIGMNYSTAYHWYLNWVDWPRRKFGKLFMYPGTLDKQFRELLEDRYLLESYQLVQDFLKGEASERNPLPRTPPVADIRKAMTPLLDAFSRPKHYYSRDSEDIAIFVVTLEKVKTLLMKINTKISKELVQSTSLSDDDKDTRQKEIIMKTSQKIGAHLEKIRKSRQIVEKVIHSYRSQ